MRAVVAGRARPDDGEGAEAVTSKAEGSRPSTLERPRPIVPVDGAVCVSCVRREGDAHRGSLSLRYLRLVFLPRVARAPLLPSCMCARAVPGARRRFPGYIMRSMWWWS